MADDFAHKLYGRRRREGVTRNSGFTLAEFTTKFVGE